MTGRVKVGVAIAVGAIAIISLGGILWVNRPFQAELGSYRTSIAERTESQRQNIRQAITSLDGVVIEPGETFSFNETVGPRTRERGYRESAAYMERDLVTSIGGGVCQVSSTLYNSAAISGLTIVERVPHFRQVASVPPGRDATVWFGVADLKLKNLFPYPVKISFVMSDIGIISTIRGGKVSRNTVNLVVVKERSAISGSTFFRLVRIVNTHGRNKIFESLSLDRYED